MALGMIGILIGFCIILYFTLKNVSTLILAPVACLVVALFNQLPLVTSFTNTYMNGVANIIIMLFPVMMLGTILGKVYTQTGGAVALANGFMKAFIDKAKGEKQIYAAMAVIVIVTFLFCMGGINPFIVLYTTFPIVVTIYKRLDLPRKYIPGIMMCSTVAACCPGAPVSQNIVPMNILGTTSTSALIPGIVATLIVGIGTWLIMSVLIVRAKRRDEHFDYGQMPVVPEFDENEQRPGFIVALIPIITVFLLFAIAKTDITVALTAGILFALVLMGRFMKGAGKDVGQGHITSKAGLILNTINDGAATSTGAIFSVSVIGGFAAVVSTTAAFQYLSGNLVNLPIHPMLIVLIAVMILVALTSSPPAGMAIIVPILAAAFLEGGTAASAGLVSAPMIHRVTTIASVTFETLPFNGMIIILLSMTKISHKEGYMPMFMTSVAFPILGAVVAALMLMAFPGLA